MDKAYTAEETQQREEISVVKINNDDKAIDQTSKEYSKKENKQEDEVNLLRFLEKVDKAASTDGGVDTDVTDTIKNWMKELKK